MAGIHYGPKASTSYIKHWLRQFCHNNELLLNYGLSGMGLMDVIVYNKLY